MPRVPAACSSQSPETGEVFTAISPHTVKTKKLGGERLRMHSTLNPAAAERWRRGRARSLLASWARAFPQLHRRPATRVPAMGIHFPHPAQLNANRSGASPPTWKSIRRVVPVLPSHPPSSLTSRPGAISLCPSPKLAHRQGALPELGCQRGSRGEGIWL